MNFITENLYEISMFFFFVLIVILMRFLFIFLWKITWNRYIARIEKMKEAATMLGLTFVNPMRTKKNPQEWANTFTDAFYCSLEESNGYHYTRLEGKYNGYDVVCRYDALRVRNYYFVVEIVLKRPCDQKYFNGHIKEFRESDPPFCYAKISILDGKLEIRVPFMYSEYEKVKATLDYGLSIVEKL